MDDDDITFTPGVAVTYTQVTNDPDMQPALWACDLCGGIVADTVLHTRWHA